MRLKYLTIKKLFHKRKRAFFICLIFLFLSVEKAISFTNPSITEPAKIIWKPDNNYRKESRIWQGCPSLEKTSKRLWAAWFSGGKTEPDKGNYGVVVYSDNDGKSWVDPAMIIEHENEDVRVMDPQLWKDPLGRLWIFWVQNYGTTTQDKIWGTWAIRIDKPTAKTPEWTKPVRIADGLTRNKVTVLSTGDWLLPSYNWVDNKSSVYISKDRGDNWQLLGGPVNEKSYFFEHMTTQLKDGRIWMLQRRMKESFSDDAGKTWSPLTDVTKFMAPDSRIFIRRLQSGNLLLVYNDDPEKKSRKNIVAVLSEDDGKTWPYKLSLDERINISYPDGVQDEQGLIYIIYDRSRTGDKEILMSTFKEEDIKSGYYGSKKSRQKVMVSKVIGN